MVLNGGKTLFPVRYAVVGLGHISQTALLPSFARAENSKLCAVLSSNPVKRKFLSELYGVTAY